MNRLLRAAASAATLLAATGFDAAAAPDVTRTYYLRCVVKPSNVDEQGMGDILVRNSTPHVIRKGTKVTMALRDGSRIVAYRVESVYRDARPGQVIEFDQRSRRLTCAWARVTLQPMAEARLNRNGILRR